MKNKNETIIDPRIDINKLNDMKIVVETLKQLSTEKQIYLAGVAVGLLGPESKPAQEVRGEMEIEKNIKLYLVKHDISQRSVAIKTGIAANKLSLSLNGKRKLGVEEFAKIIKCLDVSADLFLKE